MSLYKDASLVMIPSAYKDGKLYSIRPTDGSGDFTFTRCGGAAGCDLAATRVDVNGLIEKGRENLLLQSNQFDTTWVNVSTTETGGQPDKDGGNTAWKLQNAATAGRIQQGNFPVGLYTMSVYAKAGDVSWIQLYADETTTGNDPTCYFDLQNGVVGTSTYVIDKKIESVGNGWYRCSMSFKTIGTFAYLIFNAQNDNIRANSGEYTFIQDAQLEAGLVATDYIETGASTAQAGILEDMPRLDYSGSCPSLLLEPQRTNKLSNSEYINSGSTWVEENGADCTPNYATSPEGVDNATRVQLDNSGAFSLTRIWSNFSPDASSDTASFYAKSNTGSSFDIVIYFRDAGFGAVRGNKTITITNEWQRFDLTADCSGAAGNVMFLIYNTTASENWDFLMYGAQVEAGSYPTSYIPTYGSSVTRSKDHCLSSSLTASTDFTIFFEAPDFCLINGSTGGVFANIQLAFSSNGSAYPVDGSYHIYNNSLYYWNGSTNTSFGVIYNNQTDSKFALVKRGDSMIVFANGSKVNEVTLPSGSDAKAVNWDTISLSEGSLTDASGNVFNPYYKQVAKFDTALTDSECIALTTL
jgi:hypothetical protein